MSRSLETLRAEYGDEFPRAVNLLGVRYALTRERAFSRVYWAADRKSSFVMSRFHDGSASISLPEVEARWAGWSNDERLDLCASLGSLEGQDDVPGILRFLWQHGDPICQGTLALQVAYRLPQDEAFALLCDALGKGRPGDAANISQGVAHTKHPKAQEVLLAHLDTLWGAGDLWDDDPFTNFRAFDATCCIQHLLELGAEPALFEDKVRRLAAHPCKGNRDTCAGYLRPHYPWLPAYEAPTFGGERG